MFPVASFDRGTDIFTAYLSYGVMWVESKNTNVFRSSSLCWTKKLMRATFVIGWDFIKNGSVYKGQKMVKDKEDSDRNGAEGRINWRGHVRN